MKRKKLTTKKESTGNIHGKYRITKLDSKTGEIIEQRDYQDNLIMDGTNTGFNLILKALFGDDTYGLEIKYLDIGTGNTTPTLADTALETAVTRVTYSTRVITSSDITYRFFIANANLPNGSYEEVGLFIGGTTSVDTGQIFARSLLDSTYTKVSGEDTIIEYVISK